MQTGVWTLVSLHLPDRSAEPIGIILGDDADQLHLKFRTDWSGIGNEADIEICRGLAADLEEKGRELGAARVLDLLEDTASHTIQIAARETVQAADVNSALQVLYDEYVAEARDGPEDRASHKRYGVYIAIAAALAMTAMLGTKWAYVLGPHASISNVSPYASNSPMLLSQLPQRRLVPLHVKSALRPVSVSGHRYRTRRTIAHAHRVFKFENMRLEQPAWRAVQIDIPPSYDITELNSASLPDVILPEPPPFQARHKAFARFLAVLASSVKKLFSS